MAFFINAQKGLATPEGHFMMNKSMDLPDWEKYARGEKVYIDNTFVSPKCQSYDEFWSGLAMWVKNQMSQNDIALMNDGLGPNGENIRYLFGIKAINLDNAEGQPVEADGIRDDKSLFAVFRPGRKNEYIAWFWLDSFSSRLSHTKIYLFSCGPGGCGNYAKLEEKPAAEKLPADTVYMDHNVYLYYPADTVYMPEYNDRVEYRDRYVQTEQPYQPSMQSIPYGGGGEVLSTNNGNTYISNDSHNYTSTNISNVTTTTTTTTNPVTVVHDSVPTTHGHDGPGNPTDPDAAGNATDSAGRHASPRGNANGAQNKAQASNARADQPRSQKELDSKNGQGPRNNVPKSETNGALLASAHPVKDTHTPGPKNSLSSVSPVKTPAHENAIVPPKQNTNTNGGVKGNSHFSQPRPATQEQPQMSFSGDGRNNGGGQTINTENGGGNHNVPVRQETSTQFHQTGSQMNSGGTQMTNNSERNNSNSKTRQSQQQQQPQRQMPQQRTQQPQQQRQQMQSGSMQMGPRGGRR